MGRLYSLCRSKTKNTNEIVILRGNVMVADKAHNLIVRFDSGERNKVYTKTSFSMVVRERGIVAAQR